MDLPGLIRTIIDNPDDDVPRLVCADWYEDHGQPERAALIRAQCELHRLTALDDAPSPRQTALAAEIVALLKKHRAAWLGELPHCGGVFWHPAPNDDTPGGIFERGFVNMIMAESPTALMKDGERAFAVAPVQRLFMGWLGPRATRKFAQWPLLARLRSLQAYGVEDRSVAELARSPHLGSLRRLKLTACGITDAGAEALMQADWLGGLTHLDLRGNRLSDSGRRLLRERLAIPSGRTVRLLLDGSSP